ncbi:hypothetical protein CDAR_383411 [Caerostris darwini]|uniref:Uncharacterized protein n=1 Tax=Caerostris darwini TaxID=1538125 RepID=A0AAV4NVH8_9ARAC|nr:hypothetical protein CDAR_383411 [Caerostris darwini]
MQHKKQWQDNVEQWLTNLRISSHLKNSSEENVLCIHWRWLISSSRLNGEVFQWKLSLTSGHWEKTVFHYGGKKRAKMSMSFFVEKVAKRVSKKLHCLLWDEKFYHLSVAGQSKFVFP